MSRPDLIKQLKTKHPKLNKLQLESIIDTFFQSIEDSLKEKKSVFLRGFGTFFVKEIKEKYSARDPRNGKLIYVPKKNKVRFRASKKFKDFINQWKKKIFIACDTTNIIKVKKIIAQSQTNKIKLAISLD